MASLELVGLLKPFGSGLFAFVFPLDCAANHPAKSGSPPSSKATAGPVPGVCFFVDGASKNESPSPSIVPQASIASSFQSSTSISGCDILSLLTCTCCTTLGFGLDAAEGLSDTNWPGIVGVARPDAGVDLVCGTAAFAEVVDISPLADPSLLVKLETAQPAQEMSLGLPIRATGAPVGIPFSAGGSAVSAIVKACFRTRCRKASSARLDWSRTSFSLSSKHAQIQGMILVAQSSSVKNSIVAVSDMRAALRA